MRTVIDKNDITAADAILNEVIVLRRFVRNRVNDLYKIVAVPLPVHTPAASKIPIVLSLGTKSSVLYIFTPGTSFRVFLHFTAKPRLSTEENETGAFFVANVSAFY